MNLQKKKKGRSTQELIGIKGFSNYGLSTTRGELIFYIVSPTNISVLSAANVSIKVHHLLMVLQSVPDIELLCADSCECFDGNKQYIKERLQQEENPAVRSALEKDHDFLDSIQIEMSTARQFLFISRLKITSQPEFEPTLSI